MLKLPALTVGKTNMTDDELKALAADLAVASKRLHNHTAKRTALKRDYVVLQYSGVQVHTLSGEHLSVL